jgi:UDP-N-acetylglucosamine--N-acetylmuramyl-(pentapeptide) pyrophosphoryl-undecaprenol N-acetylglucosamine transferase
MTFPFCLAAFILKKKIFLFEPNSVLGRSNSFALKFSTKIICYFENIKNFPAKYNFKKVIIEPILKKEIYNLKKNLIKQNKEIRKILIIGGSQGASFFDKNITDLIIEISKKQKLEVIQQISNKNNLSSIKNKYDKSNINYKFIDFTNNSDELYSGIDFAITRGGASTLSELSFLNIPFISIPLPSAKDNHQYYNSEYSTIIKIIMKKLKILRKLLKKILGII